MAWNLKALKCFHAEETLKRWKVFYKGLTETGETNGKYFCIKFIL